MEPMLPAEGAAGWRDLTDLAVDLVAKANRFAGQLHPIVRDQVGDLVRSMNCYYSNLIEGHNTHPIDIDRALQHDFSQDPKKRSLQLEAKAHIDVQAMIDRGAAPSPAATTEFIQFVHREFCSRLPDDLLWVENPATHERIRVVPGELRTRHVAVGRLIPIDPESLPRFLSRFEEAYRDR